MSQSFARPQFAPADGNYLTQTTDPGLSAEQGLGSLATGYRKNTTATGVQTVQAVPIPIADGGTNKNGTFTSGSVVFSDGTRFAQDNPNLFFLNSPAQLVMGGADAGLGQNLFKADGTVIINEQSTNGVSTRFEGDTASNLLMINTAANENNVCIGTGTTGAIAKFSNLGVSGVIFNDTGLATLDFRVEGDIQANLLFVDASADQVGIRTNAPHSTFDIRGGISLEVRTVASANATLDGNDFCVTMNTGAIVRTVTLPSAAVAGRKYFIKKIDSGAGGVIVTPASGETVDAVLAGATIASQWGGWWGIADGGTNWNTIFQSL